MLDVCLRTDQLHERPLTPPSSLEAACTSTERHSDAGGGLLLSRHLAFLTGVLSLDSVAGSRAGPATHAVASTVELVLDTVLRRLDRCHDDDDDVMSHSAAVYAVDVVARIYDVTDAAVGDALRRFVQDVVANVLNNQLLDQVRHCVIQVTTGV